MKSSTTDQVQGKFHEMKGKLKENVGLATNDPNLTDEGQAEELGGTVAKTVGQIEKVSRSDDSLNQTRK
jgi:uncharacterized protein YjbJ (UPF0337 family)